MGEMFNRYQQWLDLPPGLTEPNSYELLGLAPLESDRDTIMQAAEDALTKVRNHRPNEHARQWAQLLDEVLAAKECLLDPQRKRAYDRWLKDQGVSATHSTTALRQPQSTQSTAPVNPNLYPPGMLHPASAQRGAAEPPAAAQQPTAQQFAPFGAAGAPSFDSFEQAPSSPNAWPPSAASATSSPDAWPPTAEAAKRPAPIAASASNSLETPPMWNDPPSTGTSGAAENPVDAVRFEEVAMPVWPAAPAMPVASAALPLPAAVFDPMAPVSTTWEAPPPLSASSAPLAYPAGYSADIAQAPYRYGAAPVAAPGQPMMAIPVAQAVSARPATSIPPDAAIGASVQGAMTVAPAPQIGGRPAASMAAAARARQGLQTPVIIGVGMGLLMVLSAVLYVAFNRGGAAAPDDEPLQVAQAGGPSLPQAGPAIPAAAEDANAPQGEPSQPPRGVDTGDRVQPAASGETRSAKPAVDAVAPVSPQAPDANPPAMANSADSPAIPAPMPNETPPTEPTPASPDSAPQPAPAEPTVTTPAPMPEPAADSKPTREEVAQLSEILQSARAALAEQNFDLAEGELSTAAPLAKLDEHKALVRRLTLLADYAKQFRRALEKAVSELDAAETFTVGTSTQVSFVEALPDQIKVRVAGRNRTYAYRELPAGLAVAIADLSLDQSDPASRVVKGAYLLTQKSVNAEQLAKAREWWEEAQLGGADLRELMPALEDDYDLLKNFTEDQPPGE